VQGQDEALALVQASKIISLSSEYPSPPAASNKQQNSSPLELDDENDADLRRARSLIALHATVKSQHSRSFNPDLDRARQDIGGLVERLRAAKETDAVLKA
jgi:hypothetical protein